MSATTRPWTGTEPEVARFFQGDPLGRGLFQCPARMIQAVGPSEMRVSRSQTAFRHGRTFALVWRPSMCVHIVPIVLSLALTGPLSSRLKQAVHPSSSVWMHRLEIRDTRLDDEVRQWISGAWEAAASRGRGT